MTKHYQEEIICSKCSNKFYRDIEVMETSGKSLEVEKPFKVIIIKKYECENCKNEKNNSVAIVEKNAVNS